MDVDGNDISKLDLSTQKKKKISFYIHVHING